jgi:hypothetical protein
VEAGGSVEAKGLVEVDAVARGFKGFAVSLAKALGALKDFKGLKDCVI